MTPIREVADKLRELTEDLERLNALVLELPAAGLTIPEALAKLRAVLGDVYLRVTLHVDLHSGPGRRPECDWQVYDGANHHNAPTLEGAVGKAILSNRPPQTVEDAQRALPVAAEPGTWAGDDEDL